MLTNPERLTEEQFEHMFELFRLGGYYTNVTQEGAVIKACRLRAVAFVPLAHFHAGIHKSLIDSTLKGDRNVAVPKAD